MAKIRVGVLFGGRSVEHEVSLVSATSIIRGLDQQKYLPIPIGISREGRWIVGDEALRLLKEHAPLETKAEHLLLPDPRRKALVRTSVHGMQEVPEVPVDVIFPVIHGTYGEDGSLQGLLEIADIPYVGAGVLSSALGMDKVLQKEVLRQAGIPVAPSLWFTSSVFESDPEEVLTRVEKTLKYPIFVKPSNSGSSIGISKAKERGGLKEAIRLAARYDRKVLVERAVRDAREIELSVLGNENPQASIPGEIIPSNEFYDYNAKYVDGASEAVIPARLPKTIVAKLQAIAVRAFQALDCEGMARVDFLLSRGTNAITLNEVNTIPGFTPISMYPKLWEASGIAYADLLDTLIRLAIERYEARKRVTLDFTPRKEWYRS